MEGIGDLDAPHLEIPSSSRLPSLSLALIWAPLDTILSQFLLNLLRGHITFSINRNVL